MFSHYATHKISPIYKISIFSQDLSFLNPKSHLKGAEATCVEIDTEAKKCFRLKDMLNVNVL